MPSVADIGSLIVRDPQVCGDRPHIAGTGVSVSRVAGWYKQGLSPDEIAAEFGHLDLAQVYAALAYYHANRQEIDTDLAQEDAAYRQRATSSSRAVPSR